MVRHFVPDFWQGLKPAMSCLCRAAYKFSKNMINIYMSKNLSRAE